MKPPSVHVANTVALVRYLEEGMPQKADEAFEKAETEAIMLVPDMAAAELIYVALKGCFSLWPGSCLQGSAG